MSAILVTQGMLDTPFAKTAHGLIRGPSRWPIAAVIDPVHVGKDAGEVIDNRPVGIPVVGTMAEAIEQIPRPTLCVIGVATPGGVLPDDLRGTLREALLSGLDLVNGLHALLTDDPELARAAETGGASILDIRRPPRTADLHFWSGAIRKLDTPRIALLGTDCAVGKRTTGQILRADLGRRDIHCEMVYTGQTGWLQGLEHGFILDATPNDFVSGELENAVLTCDREASPDVILIEGQSSLRNPSGPCGTELLLSAEAREVILQHTPGRTHFEDLEGVPCPLPPLDEEVALIGAYGARVLAICLNGQGIEPEDLPHLRDEIAADLGIPTTCPFEDGTEPLVDVVTSFLAQDDR